MWKGHGEDFHTVGNDKFNLSDYEIEFLRDKLLPVLDEMNEKVEVIVAKRSNMNTPNSDYRGDGMYTKEIVERKLRYDEEHKEFYVFYDNKKYWVRPVMMVFNLEEPKLYRWSILNGHDCYPKKTTNKEEANRE